MVTFLVMVVSIARGQSETLTLSLDSASSRYRYVEVIPTPGKTKEDVRTFVRSMVTSPSIIVLDTEDEIILRYTTPMGSFKFLKLTEHFWFRDDKFRWAVEDLEYLLNVSKLSHFDQLEKLDERQRRKLMPEIEGLLAEGRANMLGKINATAEKW